MQRTMTPERTRLLELFFGRRPDLRSAPVVNQINLAEFEGPALVIVPVVPPWREPTAFRDSARPYISDIHEYIRRNGLNAERFSPTQEECKRNRLVPGETIFIVTR